MGNKVIGERIEQRRKQLGLTLDDIAQEIGVAKSTVQRYERGTIETIKLPIIEAIASIMSVNPSWLCGKTDDMTPEKNKYSLDLIKNAPPYSEEALKLAEDYDGRMDDRGRETVRSVADLEVARFKARTAAALRKSREQSEAAEEIAPNIIEMLVYANPAAAGTPLYAESDYERLEFPADEVPRGADFGIRISGRSMEPTVEDGAIVWVRKTPDMLDGTVGVFMLNDSAVCKRFFKEPDGTVRLESDNPEFDPVPVTEFDTFVLVGEVVGTV